MINYCNEQRKEREGVGGCLVPKSQSRVIIVIDTRIEFGDLPIIVYPVKWDYSGKGAEVAQQFIRR